MGLAKEDRPVRVRILLAGVLLAGVALVTASMFVCDSTGCHEANDTQEIDLEKA